MTIDSTLLKTLQCVKGSYKENPDAMLWQKPLKKYLRVSMNIWRTVMNQQKTSYNDVQELEARSLRLQSIPSVGERNGSDDS